MIENQPYKTRKIDLSDELRGLLAWNSFYSTREAAFLRRYGWDGKEPGTLQESGNLLGVTRERMRQLQARFETDIRNKGKTCATLQIALNCVADSAPIAAENVGSLLIEKQLSSRPVSAQGLLEAARLIGAASPYTMEQLDYGACLFVLVKPLECLVTASEVRRCLIKLNRMIGPASVDEVICRLPSAMRQNADDGVVRRMLTSLPNIMKYTNTHGDTWFFYKDAVKRSRFNGVFRKIFSVVSDLPIGELEQAVIRSLGRNMLRPTWPHELFVLILAEYDYLFIRDGRVHSNDIFKSKVFFTPFERAVIDELGGGRVLTRDAVITAAIEYGCSENTAIVGMSFSPLLHRIAKDHYAMVGGDVVAQLGIVDGKIIPTAKRDPSGIVYMNEPEKHRFSLCRVYDRALRRCGSIGIRRFGYKYEFDSAWKLLRPDGQVRTVKYNGRLLWCLRGAFTGFNIEEGQFFCLTFDILSKTIFMELTDKQVFGEEHPRFYVRGGLLLADGRVGNQDAIKARLVFIKRRHAVRESVVMIRAHLQRALGERNFRVHSINNHNLAPYAAFWRIANNQVHGAGGAKDIFKIPKEGGTLEMEFWPQVGEAIIKAVQVS